MQLLLATPGSIRTLAPRLGEHTKELLAEIGIDSMACDALASAGVVFGEK
jgi:formyl-CoA transferase